MSETEGRKAADDRVLPVTRGVAVFILPFLMIAAFLLYVFPSRTGELFAWPIAVPMTAFLLASAYLGGIRFFVGVARTRAWHRVRRGFPAVVVFAGALLVATLLHLEKFSTNLSFFTWLTLYATTPFIIAALAIVQRPRDPRTPDPTDVAIPLFVRIGLAVIGLCAAGVGVAIYIAPAWAGGFWAWDLTPLTAQVTGAVLSLTGVVNAALLWDGRWSAFRIIFQAQLISLGAIALSLIAARGDLHWDRPMTPAFIALVGAGIIFYGGFTLWCELQLRRAASSVPSS